MAVLFTIFFIAQTITITVSSVTSLDSAVPGLLMAVVSPHWGHMLVKFWAPFSVTCCL